MGTETRGREHYDDVLSGPAPSVQFSRTDPPRDRAFLENIRERQAYQLGSICAHNPDNNERNMP